MDLLEIKNLSKSYRNNKVLDNISLSIKEGKIVGLLGQNGAGKTTLIKLITGLLTSDQGSILIDGKEIGVTTKALVSYLPERSYFNRDMSIKECFNMFEDFYKDFNREKAMDLLTKLKLDYNLYIKQMSKGMLEKLQLVLVMSRNAKLYVLDEPLGGVDPATRDYILDTILTSLDEKSSLLISTHLISDIERIIDHVLILSDGKLVVDEDADKVREEKHCSIDEMFRGMFRC